VEDLQGQGAFGYVFRCRRDSELVAVKVIKNRPNYFNAALSEIHLLQLLNKAQAERGVEVLVRMHECFVYRRHLCIVFELLGCNLYDMLRHRGHRGLPLRLVRSICAQLLCALELLGSRGVVHCDLKPENVLLVGGASVERCTHVRLIDLGSAMRLKPDTKGQPQRRQTYVQSRFYRAPEVLIGAPFSLPIDMWSLGCICAELVLGTPLFAGESEFHQLLHIARLRGQLPGAHAARRPEHAPLLPRAPAAARG